MPEGDTAVSVTFKDAEGGDSTISDPKPGDDEKTNDKKSGMGSLAPIIGGAVAVAAAGAAAVITAKKRKENK